MITKAQQRKNRLALAEMLETRVSDKQFDMAEFNNHCATKGCALGIAVMSGEFGYGWNPKWGGEPVKNGKLAGWEAVGIELFGKKAMDDIFCKFKARSRKTVAAELRAME
jgi:hypothetical protein